MSVPSSTIDPLRFREALGHYASGITVITSNVDGEPIGFTCQSFYSVSMSPPLVSFSVKSDSYSYPKIRRAGRFAVNILSGDQVSISNRFARQGANKWLDCEIHAEHIAGDHLIVIGKVKALSLEEAISVEPLLYFKGQYHSLPASIPGD